MKRKNLFILLGIVLTAVALIILGVVDISTLSVREVWFAIVLGFVGCMLIAFNSIRRPIYFCTRRAETNWWRE